MRTSPPSRKPGKGSRIARATAARLAAVQAVYQMLEGGRAASSFAKDYLDHYAGMEIDGEILLRPDEKLFGALVRGVEDRRPDLLPVIGSNLSNPAKIDEEPLLKAILLCGAYELMAHHDIDPPIIISDYLNVTRAFYSENEPSLINGILDAVRPLFRDQA